MKFNNAISGYSAIIVVLLLIIPIMAIDYVKDDTQELIKDSQNYEYVGVEVLEVDTFRYESHFNNVVVLHEDTNPQTISVDSISSANINVEYRNGVIPIGDNTYMATKSYLFPNNAEWVTMQLNITPSDVVNAKFIKVYSEYLDDNSLFFISGFETAGDHGRWFLDDIWLNDTTKMFYIDISSAPIWLSMPDDKVMLEIWRDNELLAWDENITFKVEIAQTNINTTFEIEDTTYYLIIVSSMIIVNIFTLILMTDTIDIFIDKRRHGWKK